MRLTCGNALMHDIANEAQMFALQAVRTALSIRSGESRREGPIMATATGQPRITVSQTQSGMLPALMTPEEWHELTGLSKRYIQTQCKRGDLPVCRVGGGRYRILTRKAFNALGIEL
jgi:hypothetical protein